MQIYKWVVFPCPFPFFAAVFHGRASWWERGQSSPAGVNAGGTVVTNALRPDKVKPRIFLKKKKKEQKITNKLYFTKLKNKSGWASPIPHQPCCFHLLTENSSRTLQTESFFPVFLGMPQLQLGMPAPLCSRIRGNPRQPVPARVVKIIKLHFCALFTVPLIQLFPGDFSSGLVFVLQTSSRVCPSLCFGNNFNFTIIKPSQTLPYYVPWSWNSWRRGGEHRSHLGLFCRCLLCSRKEQTLKPDVGGILPRDGFAQVGGMEVALAQRRAPKLDSS